MIDDPESIIRCGNKVYLVELAKRLDLAIPPTMVVSSARTDDVIRELGLPCVLKQPDSAFSEGVFRADTREQLSAGLQRLLSRSDLVVVQSFMPTEFDWRVAVLDRQPLFVCRYYMADGHWQIYHHGERRERRRPDHRMRHAPRGVLIRFETANAVGDGFYGVDIKTVNGRQVLMESTTTRASTAASRMPCSATSSHARDEGVQGPRRCRQAIQARRLTARAGDGAPPDPRPRRSRSACSTRTASRSSTCPSTRRRSTWRPARTSCSRRPPASTPTSSRTAPSPGTTSSRCT